MKKNIFLFIFCNLLLATTSFSQIKDTALVLKKDTTAKAKSIQKHDPHLATKRSLMLPGWGQAYNKQYWKIPVVYGALSIPTITFIYNNTYYKEAKFAYEARYKATIDGGKDSTDYKTLETKYQKADISAIQSLRNAARRDRDYSILWFLIVWGLNVADATVFGHLKDFDVSSDLSMNIRPEFNPATKTPGLSFAFKLKDKKKSKLITDFSAR